jgi:hypothetical protein
MNSDLRQFIAKYLSIVFGTLMTVSFVAFVSIPYSFGGTPGEENLYQTSTTLASTSSSTSSSTVSSSAVKG